MSSGASRETRYPEKVGVELDWLKITEADNPEIDGTAWVLYNPGPGSDEEWIQAKARIDAKEAR